jgi:YD repeat-containing protein
MDAMVPFSAKPDDEMNRVTSTTDPAGQTTLFGYGRVAAGDGGDTMRTLTDATAKSYTFTSDKLGRRTKTTHPAVGGSSAQETWTYDGVGNMKTFTNRAGAVLTNTYDNRNRVTSANWSDSTPDVTNAKVPDRLLTSPSRLRCSLHPAFPPPRLKSAAPPFTLAPCAESCPSPPLLPRLRPPISNSASGMNRPCR